MLESQRLDPNSRRHSMVSVIVYLGSLIIAKFSETKHSFKKWIKINVIKFIS